MSWTDVNPGEEGFVYHPYGGGVDKERTFNEGTIFIAPWNEMITYNTRQQSKNFTSEVMDINGTDIIVKVAVNYAATGGKTADLHLKHGPSYISFIDDKAKKIITTFKMKISTLTNLSKDTLEPIVNDLIKEYETNFKGVGQPLRVILTGSKFGPGIYDIIISLGKQEVEKRLGNKILSQY